MVDKKRLSLFLALAFGISWLSALAISLTGGLENSPEILPGSGITLALILLSSVYMWGPAAAHILTRLITREGRQGNLLALKIRTAWPFYLTGWFGPGVMTIVGILLFFLAFPHTYDAGFTTLQEQLRASGNQALLENPSSLIIQQTVMALIIAPLVNLVATFGEEFGWRGYLLPKLNVLGKRKALLISSLIWGVWHWPVIAMGHNYGLSYAGFPWLGLLATVWVMLSFGIFIGWLSQKAESVWPAVIAHGALNGIAALGLLFVLEPFPVLLGPTPAGILSCLPFTLVSGMILLRIKE